MVHKMLQPSRWSGPGPPSDELIEMLQRAYNAAFNELDREHSEREGIIKQSFWALNAKYGKLGENATNETAALRQQLANAQSVRNNSTEEATTEFQELRMQYRKLTLKLTEREKQLQDACQLKEQIEVQLSDTKRDLNAKTKETELEHQKLLARFEKLTLELKNQHDQVRNDSWLREQLHKELADAKTDHSFRSHVAAAQRQKLQAKCDRLRLELKEREDQARAELQLKEQCQHDFGNTTVELRILQKEHSDAKKQVMRLQNEHSNTVEEMKQAAKRREKEDDNAAAMGQIEQFARRSELQAFKAKHNALIDQLARKHATEIDTCKESTRTDERKVSEESHSAKLAQIQIQHAKEIKEIEQCAGEKQRKTYEAKSRATRDELNQEHEKALAASQEKFDTYASQKCTEYTANILQLQRAMNQDKVDMQMRTAELCEQNRQFWQHMMSQVTGRPCFIHERAPQELLPGSRLMAQQIDEITRLTEQVKVVSTRVSALTLDIQSLEAQRNHFQQEAVAKDSRLTQLQSTYETHKKSLEHQIREKWAEINELVKQVESKDEMVRRLEQKLREEEVETNRLGEYHRTDLSALRRGRVPESTLHAEECQHPRGAQPETQESTKHHPNVTLGNQKKAETLEEAQHQLSELNKRLLECQKRIETMQNEQDILLQQELRSWIAKTTTSQTRPSEPELFHESLIIVKLPSDTEESKRNQQILAQLITGCETLERECRDEEAEHEVESTKLRNEDAKLKGLQKDHTNEFSFKPAKNTAARQIANA